MNNVVLFSEEKMKRSRELSRLALKFIYPIVFYGKTFSFQVYDASKMDATPEDHIYDKQLATDIRFKVEDLKFGVSRYCNVQERFLEYKGHKPTMTIAVSHHDPVTLEKICDGEYGKLDALSHFLTAYYDPKTKKFVDFVMIDHPYRVRDLIEAGHIPYGERWNELEGKKEKFVFVDFDELEKRDLIYRVNDVPLRFKTMQSMIKKGRTQ
jgi:hypothetical protein